MRKCREAPTRADERRSMDFASDGLETGRGFGTLNVVDDFTRECVAIEVDTSISGERVGRVLDRVIERLGLPTTVIVDSGPELTSRALDAWAYRRGIQLDFIRPGTPVENCFVESFNGKFRHEWPERTLVSRLGRCSATDRDLAPGLQPGQAAPSLGDLAPRSTRRCRSSSRLRRLPLPQRVSSMNRRDSHKHCADSGVRSGQHRDGFRGPRHVSEV